MRCSTPFGITEVGIDAPIAIPMPARACSTPFGITEVGIRRRATRAASTRSSAQRLSASQRWACATVDRGERDRASAQRLSASQRWASRACDSSASRRIDVLNAFRHHRGGHADRHPSGSRHDSCAQRLSASLRWASRRRRSPLGAIACAQRLSASQRWAYGSPTSIADATRCAQRLSASQRWASAGHASAGATSPSAQRLSASQRWASVPSTRHRRSADVCSTPFGITEVGISGSADAAIAIDGVLNAFRHHRGGHYIVPARSSSRLRAQRLSASQRWASAAARAVDAAIASAQRLSASQRWACDARRRWSRHAHGAQRLSASQRWACVMRVSRRGDSRVCSTPFGITEVGIAPFQTPSMKHLAQAVFKVGVGSQPKADERGLAPLRPTAQFFQGTGVRENHGSSELPRSLKFNPRNLLSGFLGLGPPHSRGCLNCAKRRDRDLGRRHLPCATVRRCHTAPGRRASSGRSGRSGSFPCPPRIGRRGE